MYCDAKINIGDNNETNIFRKNYQINHCIKHTSEHVYNDELQYMFTVLLRIDCKSINLYRKKTWFLIFPQISNLIKKIPLIQNLDFNLKIFNSYKKTYIFKRNLKDINI